jgi:hypothetical protein
MPRRLVLSLAAALVLVTGLGGCSRSNQSKPAAADASLSKIWAEILDQRDAIHRVFMIELEDVTHQDCADLGAAARQMNSLMGDFTGAIGRMPNADSGKLRAVSDAISRLSSVTNRIREQALAEAPGAFPEQRYPLDFCLRDIERYFTADDLGGQSVASRPGFETEPLPAPLSPI